jgi:stress response protein SCP2
MPRSLAVFSPALKVTETASFAMPTVVNGLIRHNGDSRRKNQKGDHESITVKLATLPDTVKGVCIQITSYKSGDLSQVKGTYVRLVDRDTKVELMYNKVGEGEPKHGFFYALFYRDEEDWEFMVANQYFDAVKPSEMVPNVEAWLKESGLFEVGKKKKRRARKKKVAPRQDRNEAAPDRNYSLTVISGRFGVPVAKTIDICVGWESKADIEASVSAFDAKPALIGTASFAAPKILDAAIFHHGGARLLRGKGDNAVISVKLSRLPPAVKYIAIVLSSLRGVPFSDVKSMTLRLRVKKTWLELLFIKTGAGPRQTGLFWAALVKGETDWTFVPQLKYSDGKKPTEVVKEVEALMKTPQFAERVGAAASLENSPLDYEGKAPPEAPPPE